MSTEPLPHDIREFARQHPDQAAVVLASSGAQLTFAELDATSRAVADLLWDLGLREGDNVALLMDNQLEFMSVYWAAMRSGLYITAVSPYLTAAEASFILSDCDARVLFVGESRAPTARVLERSEMPRLDHVLLFGDHEALPDGWNRVSDRLRRRSGSRPALEPMGRVMLYSSGTTGRPKGIKRALPGAPFGSGGDLARTVPALFGVTDQTVYLSTAPLYHLAAAVYVDAVNSNGGTVVVMERFDALRALELIEEHRVTMAQFVPTMLIRILKLPREQRERFDLSSLRTIVHGAGPCPPHVKEELIDWLGPIVWEYYGGTEDNGNTVISSPEWLEHRGSVGRPLEGTRVHVSDSEGDEVPVGEIGVVYLESVPARPIFQYHGNPAATESSRNPKHPTWTTLGDIGRVDEDGYLYLTDRLNFTIVSGGVNVYPREIEDVLLRHPMVADAAVFGVPHDEMGEVVKAVVQPADGALPADELEAELIRFTRDNLAHYKSPRSIDVVVDFPRLPTGKLNKQTLVDEYRRAFHGS